MSLRSFHIFFILVSIVFCFSFAYWCFTAGAVGSVTMGALFSLLGVGLLSYGAWFVKKGGGPVNGHA